MIDRLRRLDADVVRLWVLGGVGVVWLAAIGVIFATVLPPPPTVVVVHWANGHPMDAPLLPAFAQRFNAAEHYTSSGARIKVEPHLVNSGVIRRELVSRVRTGVPLNRNLPDPTIVTPVVEHWFHDINHAAGQAVIDVKSTKPLVKTWIGIVTFRDMAECIGWPGREIGYSDIVALSSDPLGWERYPCAKAEWGRRPLFTATDPNRSSTGRSVLFTLYSIAAGKPPEQLTDADVGASQVADYLRTFQRSVAHYVPDTLLLNCEIFGGPRFGHFFFIAEDNLVKLYKGRLVGTDPELERLYPCKRAIAPLERSMVMIYPREGSTAHTHPAAIVQSRWVSPDQGEAADRWIAFLLEDAQQAAFMEEGFRPASSLPPRCPPICGQFGLDPAGPRAVIDPNKIPPPVAEKIVGSWGDVKNPGVVVFVLDSSVSMAGAKLQSARDGLIGAIDAMYPRNLVGLVTFSTAVHQRVEPAPVAENRFAVVDAVQRAQAGGASGLYDAIAEGIALADRASAEPTAIRGVVVLTGGPANTGRPLHDLIELASTDGRAIRACGGFSGGQCLDESGQLIDMTRVDGARLAIPTTNAVHVYYVGIGENADLEVGRVIADATGSDVVAAKVEDLARVVRTFSEYF